MQHKNKAKIDNFERSLMTIQQQFIQLAQLAPFDQQKQQNLIAKLPISLQQAYQQHDHDAAKKLLGQQDYFANESHITCFSL